MTGSSVLKVSKRDRWWDIFSSIKISAFNCYSSMATATGFETDPLPHFYCSKFLRGRVVGWGSWWPMCGGPWRMKLNSLDDQRGQITGPVAENRMRLSVDSSFRRDSWLLPLKIWATSRGITDGDGTDRLSISSKSVHWVLDLKEKKTPP